MSFFTGVADLAGGLISSHSARKAQEDANKLNRELYYADREWNKPINQVARLREAGLNPNLVYGSGSGAMAGNTSKGAPHMESIGGYDVDFAGAINAALTYGALKKQDEETNNVVLTNKNLKAQNEEINARRKGVELDNELKKHDLDLIRNSPVGSKDHGVTSQVLKSVNWFGNQLSLLPDDPRVLKAGNYLKSGYNYVSDKVGSFIRGASDKFIPDEMRGKKVDKGVPKQKSNKPWSVRFQGKPWFIRYK